MFILEPLHQTVVWPSYSQPPSHVLLPQIPPPPLQLLSSASSDYLSSSTTLHQHTQTHSTRLLSVTTDTKRKIPLPIPATTLIKIETDATTLDQTKTLQAVSTIASNTATVFTDQSVAPLVTTHLIYQHPTNLILSQTPVPETSSRSQSTSPATCLTPPPEDNPHNEEDILAVQDASNQTESPICSEDDITVHAIIEEIGLKCDERFNNKPVDEFSDKFSKNIGDSAEAMPKRVDECNSGKDNRENRLSNIQLLNSESFESENQKIAEESVKPDSTQEKLQGEITLKPDLSGLELLSSIVEFENCRKSFDEIVVKQEVESEQNEDVLKAIADMSLKDHDTKHLPKKIEDTFGGLDLLCALAEQRILEEVTERHTHEVIKSDKEQQKRSGKIKEKRKSKRYCNEFSHKRNILEYTNCNIKHSDKKNAYEKYFDFELNIKSKDQGVIHTSREMNKNQCSCGTDESYRTYKTRESEEEVKKFIASKSQPICCKGNWPCMNQNELDMRKKLADLQKKYREKQKELNKLKIKKPADNKDWPKASRSRKKSLHSEVDRETPPPTLDKMDMPIKLNKSNQELLKPPTLCAYGSDDMKLDSKGLLNNKREYIEDSPANCCYSPSIDLSDCTPEKTLSSSKKRKVGRPKKLLTSSGLRTGTETIVAKKPKKGNIVGYLLAAKEKLVQSKNGQLYLNSPPRFVEEVKEFPEYSPLKSGNEGGTSKKKHNKKNVKTKIRPKLKAEPIVKKLTEEEGIAHEWSKNNVNRKLELEETENTPANEIKENKETIGGDIVDDQRCILTKQHLEMDKLRVLTAMGGLFYAGHFNAVEPPDVYSITLDGERGNRPHIMSREEILRDAVSSFNELIFF